jgi:hypothetical protein
MLNQIHEITYDKSRGTVQLFDIHRQAIKWANGDDKLPISIESLIALLVFLRTFGYAFQSLWDIDENTHWIHTRVYADRREKGFDINKRYYDPIAKLIGK